MFGRSGVGKTSLLASMFSRIQDLPAFALISASSQQSHELEVTLELLRRYIRSLGEGRPKGLVSGRMKQEFTFALKLNSLPDFELEIVITDMPGETLDQPERKEEWIRLLRETDIIIAVISAPSMMEEKREYNEDFNKPSRFKEYLGLALADAQTTWTKHLYLVPVKCEKYLGDETTLSAVVQRTYSNHRTLVRSYGHFCYGLAISTLGTVIFDRFEVLGDGSVIEHFKLREHGVTSWEPRNQEVLLAHILTYGIEKLAKSFPTQTAGMFDPVTAEISPLLTAEAYDKPALVYVKPFKMPSKGGCFHGDTLIIVEGGKSMRIADVRKGMGVLTLNREDRYEVQRVVGVGRHPHIAMMALTFGDVTLHVTREHLFRVGDGWRRAEKLVVGDSVGAVEIEVLRPAGKRVTRIFNESLVCEGFNLYVARNANYFAGGTLVSSFVRLNKVRRAAEYVRSAFAGIGGGLSDG